MFERKTSIIIHTGVHKSQNVWVAVNYNSHSGWVKLYQSHVQSKDLTTWSIFQIYNTVTLILKESLHRQKCNDSKILKEGFYEDFNVIYDFDCIQWNCKL